MQLLLQNPQLQGHLLQFALGLGAADQTGPGRQFQLVPAQGAAADRHPQVGVAFTVKPADGGGVMAPFEGFQRAQPGHRLPAGQARHGGRRMQSFRQGQGVLPPQAGGDWRVQMHQRSMARQARVSGTPWVQASRLQHFGDRVHHQLVFMAVLDGAQQVGGGFPLGGGAGQAVAA